MSVAGPRYLDKHGVPTSMAELRGHELLTWAPPDREVTCWPCADGTCVTVEPHVICTNNEVVHHLAAAGAGVALMPHADLRVPGLGFSMDDLVAVLPDVVRGARTIRVKVSDELLSVPAFRSLLDITQRFAEQFIGVRTQ